VFLVGGGGGRTLLDKMVAPLRVLEVFGTKYLKKLLVSRTVESQTADRLVI